MGLVSWRWPADAQIVGRPHYLFKTCIQYLEYRFSIMGLPNFHESPDVQARSRMARRVRRGLQDRQRLQGRRPARHGAGGGQHHAEQAARALRRPAVRAHRAGHAAHALRPAARRPRARSAVATRPGARQPRRLRSRRGAAQLPHLHDRHQRGGAAAGPARPPAARGAGRAHRDRDHLDRKRPPAGRRRGRPGGGLHAAARRRLLPADALHAELRLPRGAEPSAHRRPAHAQALRGGGACGDLVLGHRPCHRRQDDRAPAASSATWWRGCRAS